VPNGPLTVEFNFKKPFERFLTRFLLVCACLPGFLLYSFGIQKKKFFFNLLKPKRGQRGKQKTAEPRTVFFPGFHRTPCVLRPLGPKEQHFPSRARLCFKGRVFCSGRRGTKSGTLPGWAVLIHPRKRASPPLRDSFCSKILASTFCDVFRTPLTRRRTCTYWEKKFDFQTPNFFPKLALNKKNFYTSVFLLLFDLGQLRSDGLEKKNITPTGGEGAWPSLGLCRSYTLGVHCKVWIPMRGTSGASPPTQKNKPAPQGRPLEFGDPCQASDLGGGEPTRSNSRFFWKPNARKKVPRPLRESGIHAGW